VEKVGIVVSDARRAPKEASRLSKGVRMRLSVLTARWVGGLAYGLFHVSVDPDP
jgi:hypothetical protein